MTTEKRWFSLTGVLGFLRKRRRSRASIELESQLERARRPVDDSKLTLKTLGDLVDEDVDIGELRPSGNPPPLIRV